MRVIAARARALSRTLAGPAWLWGINSFAGGKALTQHGTEEQKSRFLPDIAAGKLRAAISLTEPGGGTDVLGATRTFAKKVDGGWRISGEKIWSSQSLVADYLLLLARTDPDPAKNHHGLTLFWVPAKSQGITITLLKKLGMRARWAAAWSIWRTCSSPTTRACRGHLTRPKIAQHCRRKMP
jgi:acyl-CoA dehydrogenase